MITQKVEFKKSRFLYIYIDVCIYMFKNVCRCIYINEYIDKIYFQESKINFISDDNIRSTIQEKLAPYGKISYLEIATAAYQTGTYVYQYIYIHYSIYKYINICIYVYIYIYIFIYMCISA
jgi:hypothetical protein